ncbi:hypothetical protein ASPZODRAFT_71409 [Penicilliopsis zonata CBS 506.65]|uniref:HhH-GPD domain-containing protein n=1 Tax=Penicilliopsis zonata CBS 506.65 TaxID=1073090 RepID=A0A1L9SC55_9EURO|nr:hypothetical protein ASPZODRAFT_71409 [Penicilliopsis zonata CBS 506.65]OJJ44756.1 hypothetical protein ASPZODRAFT_71409 [Penicilliopsis zonata CBS 506.65]
MSLRRSARLSALPNTSRVLSLHQAAGPRRTARTPGNGITKTKKASTKRKKPTIPTDEDIFKANPNNGDNDDDDNPSILFLNGSSSRQHLTPPPLDRPVDPHRTGAALLTPHGSSLVAYPPTTELKDLSPSKTGLPRPTATTGTLLERAVAHLIATDPRLKPVIDQYPCELFSPAGLAEEINPFKSLVSSIIGQQVSGAAARSIQKKFIALFNSGPDDPSHQDQDQGQEQPSNPFPTPPEVAACDIPTLRTAGLSQRKAEYIQGLAQKFADGDLGAEMLLKATDDELIDKLTAVRGLGKWSVEMFACFALKRIDVFSTGDLGVQRGCASFTGRNWKYMSEQEMLDLAAKFAPYRSLFMWYMWRIEDVDIAVLAD